MEKKIRSGSNSKSSSQRQGAKALGGRIKQRSRSSVKKNVATKV